MHLESNGSVSANDSGITDASGVFTTRQFVRDADVYVSSSSLTHGSLTWLSALDLDNPLIVTVP
ncbi:hypothetical protein GKO48_09295 [Candidatus Lucifugimonas marina]|nr:hypothetical protein GKO48_09295 [SAR202 cluster bacterium JH1073]